MILRAEPVTLPNPLQVYAQMVERVDAAYDGGPINWLQLDDIEKRIWSAETMAELMLAVKNYERVV